MRPISRAATTKQRDAVSLLLHNASPRATDAPSASRRQTSVVRVSGMCSCLQLQQPWRDEHFPSPVSSFRFTLCSSKSRGRRHYAYRVIQMRWRGSLRYFQQPMHSRRLQSQKVKKSVSSAIPHASQPTFLLRPAPTGPFQQTPPPRPSAGSHLGATVNSTIS